MHPQANNWEIPRFHLPSHTEADVAALGRAERDYLHSVLRLYPGDKVRLYDGRGAEALCEIAEFKRSECRLSIVERFEYLNRPSGELTLCFSLLKKGLSDEIVAQCAQLGVTHFQPMITERTQARPGKASREKMLRRFQEIAVQASGRALRSDVPLITDIMVMPDLVSQPSLASVFLFEGGGTISLGEFAGRPAAREKMRLLIGPEGGLSASEVGQLEQIGFARAAFGSRILKAHTAAIAAVSVVMQMRGEFGSTEDK